MSLDVIGFGALNVDKLYKVNRIAKEDEESHIKSFTRSCGGSAVNTIVGLSRLGLKTGYIGKISNDLDGSLILENLRIEGVNTNGISIEEGRSGNVMGFIDTDGQRALYVDPGVNDLIKLDDINIEYLKNLGILHLTSFVGESVKAQEALLNMLPSTVKVSFDPGRLYAQKGIDYLKRILDKTDILLLNEAELQLLTGEVNDYKALLDYNIDVIIVKQGSKGCYYVTVTESCPVKALQVKCTDTTGAGDAFNAGFLYGLLEGENYYNSCLIGNIVAAYCVGSVGAMNNLPYPSEVMRIFKKLKKN